MEKISYQELNARQKENYNFQKVSAVLADYGYVTFRLSDDWQGADFIALHIGGSVLRVQLKGRLTFQKAYEGKELYVAFPHEDDWYLYPHDALLVEVLSVTNVATSKSWRAGGGYSFPGLSKKLKPLLQPYRISGETRGLQK